MNLANRTVNNAFFNTLGWIASLGLSFFFLPYIVSKLGPDAYGILTLVLTVIGYFAVLDLGLGNAVVKYVAEYSAQNDARKMNEVIGATILVLCILGILGATVIFMMSDSLVTNFLKVPKSLVYPAYLSFCVGAVGFFATMVLSALSAIPNGLNRYDITSLISFLMGTATMLGTVYIVYLGYGVYAVVWLNFGITLVGVAVYPLVLRKIMPAIKFTPAITLQVVKTVLNYGIYSFCSRIAYLLTYQADRVVLGVLMGLSSVTYYVVPFTLVSRVTNLTVRIGAVIFPAISELQGYNRYDTIKELYLVASRIILILSTAICLPLFVFGGRFLTLWMGEEFGSKAEFVLVVLTAGLYVNSLTNIPSFVADGLGKPKLTGLAGISAAILNVAFLIPLTKLYGITGASFAFLISNATVGPVFVWIVNGKLLGMSNLHYARQVLVRPLAAAVLTVIPFTFIGQGQIANIYFLIAIMATFSSLYLLICYLIGAMPQQFVSAMLEKIFKRRSKIPILHVD